MYTAILYPYNSNTNRYLTILRDGLTSEGVNVVSLREAFKSIKIFKRVKVVHFNWFENLQGNTLFGIYWSFLSKLLILSVLLVFRKKIVWTMHNKMPHDQYMLSLKRCFLKIIINKSDRIIIHSKISEDLLAEAFGEAKIRPKIKYVPHPNYINEYGMLADHSGSDPRYRDKIRLLFLGAVKPYKNVELLIDLMKLLGKENVELKIAGNVDSGQYKQHIEHCAFGCNNVELQLEFIPDDNLSRVIQMADVLVLPYDMDTSLNSGTVFLAFSYKRTVICPSIGTIMDIPDHSKLFTYTYTSAENHGVELLSAIHRLLDSVKADNAYIDSAGTAMYHYVDTYHKKSSFVKAVRSIYES